MIKSWMIYSENSQLSYPMQWDMLDVRVKLMSQLLLPSSNEGNVSAAVNRIFSFCEVADGEI